MVGMSSVPRRGFSHRPLLASSEVWLSNNQNFRLDASTDNKEEEYMVLKASFPIP